MNIIHSLLDNYCLGVTLVIKVVLVIKNFDKKATFTQKQLQDMKAHGSSRTTAIPVYLNYHLLGTYQS